MTAHKETLASREERILDPGAGLIEHTEAISPDPFGWWCPQSRLEPLLLATAKQRGGDVRYSTELVSFTHDDAEVDQQDGARPTSYSVLADGAVEFQALHSKLT